MDPRRTVIIIRSVSMRSNKGFGCDTMDRPRILLTRALPEEGIERLHKESELDLWDSDLPIPRGELMDRIDAADALICLLSDRIDEELLRRGARLRAIGVYAVGYDNVDVNAATARGIPVFNTPGVLTDATADMAFALLLSLARRIVEGDRMVREGRFRSWGPKLFLGKDLRGSTLGVVGAGSIGGAVLRRGKAFGMDLVYHSRTRKDALESELGARYAGLDELLSVSDVVSLNVPLTSETHHLIGAREFGLMKDDALLVNTARGPVVDEVELYEALASGSIGGAALDVYEREPDVYAPLLKLDNVVLAPHLGSATVHTRTKMARMVCDAVLDHLNGGRPENCVNPSVLVSEEEGK